MFLMVGLFYWNRRVRDGDMGIELVGGVVLGIENGYVVGRI